MRTVYSWRCPRDGAKVDSPAGELCPVCSEPMVRDYSSVNLRGPVFQPHFNHAVGRYVQTSRDFDEALKMGSEANGAPYSRIDPGDYASITPGSHTEVIEAQARAHRDAGLTEAKQTVIPL